VIQKFSWQKLEYFIGAAISIIALVVYSITLCPTVNFIDSGELATDVYTLGIAHPSGYPMFTIVEWIFSHVPFGLRIIYQLNLLAALFCAGALFFFFRFFVLVMNVIFHAKPVFDGSSVKVTEKILVYVFLPAIFGTLVLGFSGTYWAQALSIEVYPLHLLFVSIILFLFTKAAMMEQKKSQLDREGISAESSWLGFAFVLGLSFTNHMTTILLAPAFLCLFFWVHGASSNAWKRIARLVPPFLLGLTPYLYLPVRALQVPVMNWGNPIDAERFFRHVSAKVYHVWIFSSSEAAGKQLKYFVDTLPDLFAYFPLVFAIIGLTWLFKKSKSLFFFTTLLLVGCLAYSINYDINDIDSYFLLAYIAIAIWAGTGCLRIISLMQEFQSARRIAIACIASCIIILVANYSSADQSDNRIVEEYTRDMFSSIEPNGIIITSQWDYLVSSAYYFQLVEKVRPDVVVIDKELMRRSWYYPQLNTRFPWLTAQSKKEIDLFVIEANKFERDIPYNPSVIEFRYASLIRSFIEQNYRSRPVYVTQDVGKEYTKGYNLVATGLAWRVYPDTVHHESPAVHFNFHIPHLRDKYVDGIVGMYATAWYNNAVSAALSKRKNDALDYLNRALEIEPNFREASDLKSFVERGK